ncbi:MAG: hypothetical protein IIB06_00705 [Bacteroidetes bacterium]|nr:hypothetical protein [Bacteroidota bacterium]
MATYKEQQENRKSYVLLKDCEVLGTFGNLKKICEFMEGEDFYSYNTIIRKKDFPILYKGYKIFKVKHH